MFQESAKIILRKPKQKDKYDGSIETSTSIEHGTHERRDGAKSESNDQAETDAASIFFDLANSPLIGYQINANQTIVIRQDNNCAIHTGGIVWETSYLLAEFLMNKFGSNGVTHHPLGKTLEIGAGCGMLGLILGASGLSSKVVLTEASEVMANLKDNIDENVSDIEGESHKMGTMRLQLKGVHGTIYSPACPKHRVSVRQLRWDQLKADIKSDATRHDSIKGESHDLQPHSFDTIVGTDVVFSPSLVCPLLKTLSKMARKKSKTKDVNKAAQSSSNATLIYLCLQIRCPDSHALLFSEACKYGLKVSDASHELRGTRCAWGLDLECVLLKMEVVSKKHS
eukprot:scaffold374698_cov116-Cyclotella_meneghiniana.AAC.1